MRPHDRNVAGLTCAEVMTALSDFVAGDLPASVAAQIEAHVAECPQCQRFGGGFARLLDAMRRHLAPPDAVPAEVTARLRAAIRR